MMPSFMRGEITQPGGLGKKKEAGFWTGDHFQHKNQSTGGNRPGCHPVTIGILPAWVAKNTQADACATLLLRVFATVALRFCASGAFGAALASMASRRTAHEHERSDEKEEKCFHVRRV
jgi:hypothetical protein